MSKQFEILKIEGGHASRIATGETLGYYTLTQVVDLMQRGKAILRVINEDDSPATAPKRAPSRAHHPIDDPFDEENPTNGEEEGEEWEGEDSGDESEPEPKRRGRGKRK